MAELYYPPEENGLSKQLTKHLDDGYTTDLTLNNTTGILNRRGVCVINRIDSDGELMSSGDREYVSFTGVSGDTLTGLTRGLGGSIDTNHDVGSVVEFLNDVTQQEALLDVIKEEHDADGTHGDVTATSIDIGSTIAVTGILDEDDMSSDSDTAVPTQQSAKAYVDGVPTNTSLTKDEDDMASDSADHLATQQSVKAYVDDQAINSGVRCDVYLSSSYNPGDSGTAHTVPFDSENYDTGGDFNTSTYKFTAPTAGYYLVVVHVKWKAYSDQDRCYLTLYKNSDVEVAVSYADMARSASNQFSEITKVVSLSASDTLYAKVINFDSNTQLDGADSGDSYMSIHLLST